MQLFKCWTTWNPPDELNLSVWNSQGLMLQFPIGNQFYIKTWQILSKEFYCNAAENSLFEIYCSVLGHILNLTVKGIHYSNSYSDENEN